MKISEWLKTLNPLAILYQYKTAADFERRCNQPADWPVHTWAECCDHVRLPAESVPFAKRGKPAGAALPWHSPSMEVAYAYEIAQHLCREQTGEDVEDYIGTKKAARKADIWLQSIELLERAGL